MEFKTIAHNTARRVRFGIAAGDIYLHVAEHFDRQGRLDQQLSDQLGVLLIEIREFRDEVHSYRENEMQLSGDDFTRLSRIRSELIARCKQIGLTRQLMQAAGNWLPYPADIDLTIQMQAVSDG
jgi:hypothetical protein